MVLHLTCSHSTPFVCFLTLCCVSRNYLSTKMLSLYVYSNKASANQDFKAALSRQCNSQRQTFLLDNPRSISQVHQCSQAEQTKEAPSNRFDSTQEMQHPMYTHFSGIHITWSCCPLVHILNSEVLTMVNKIWQRDKGFGSTKSLGGLWEFVDRQVTLSPFPLKATKRSHAESDASSYPNIIYPD